MNAFHTQHLMLIDMNDADAIVDDVFVVVNCDLHVNFYWLWDLSLLMTMMWSQWRNGSQPFVAKKLLAQLTPWSVNLSLLTWSPWYHHEITMITMISPWSPWYHRDHHDVAIANRLIIFENGVTYNLLRGYKNGLRDMVHRSNSI